MTRSSTARRSEQGFAALQLLIIFAIVAALAGIALPVYASRAKDVVLQQNADSLEMQVKSCLALYPDSGFVPDGGLGAGDAAGGGKSASAAVARALRSGDAGRYVNPSSGSTAILCQSAPPRGGQARPAVWITDNQACAYEALSGSGADADLEGTLLVVFGGRDGGQSTVDVFSIDRGGRCSNEAATLTF